MTEIRWRWNDRRTVVFVLLLIGFLVTLKIACRDAYAGYRFRLNNQTETPLDIYSESAQLDGRHVRFVGKVDAHSTSDWLEALGEPAEELVFVPRNAVQRIGRIELGGDAVRGVGNKDVPLVICLRQTGTTVYGMEGGEKPYPRLGWNLPLLYVAAIGWFGTFWCGRLPGFRRNG